MDHKIRLTKLERIGILQAFSDFINGKSAKLYLFGSRVDTQKKGGDIDLLVVIDKKWLDWLLADKIFLLTKIKAQIGEQRIDVTCAAPEQLTTDSFLKNISAEMVLLN
jgi:predicted nucleotidyltransferase